MHACMFYSCSSSSSSSIFTIRGGRERENTGQRHVIGGNLRDEDEERKERKERKKGNFCRVVAVSFSYTGAERENAEIENHT